MADEITNIIGQTLIVPMKICKNVIKGLLLFAGALVIAIAYITALGLLVIGGSAIIIGIMNFTAGAASAFMFAFGGGLLLLGLVAPVFCITTYALKEYIGLTAKTIGEFKEGVRKIEVE